MPAAAAAEATGVRFISRFSANQCTSTSQSNIGSGGTLSHHTIAGRLPLFEGHTLFERICAGRWELCISLRSLNLDKTPVPQARAKPRITSHQHLDIAQDTPEGTTTMSTAVAVDMDDLPNYR